MYKLRKFTWNKDGQYLFNLMKNHSEINVFPKQRKLFNIERFCDWICGQLSGYYNELYMVEDAEEAKGFVLCYDYRIYDGHCMIYGYFEKTADCAALKKFMDILIREYPINKFFIEVTDVERNFLETALQVGFKKEAVLKKNKYIMGRYYDLYILSLYTENWRKKDGSEECETE